MSRPTTRASRTAFARAMGDESAAGGERKAPRQVVLGGTRARGYPRSNRSRGIESRGGEL